MSEEREVSKESGSSKSNDVTCAESFHTCQTEAFFGREYVDIVQRLNDHAAVARSAYFGQVDMRNPKRKKVTFRDVATLYGQRPLIPDVWYLSPYEFATYWEPVLLSYPMSERDNESDEFHATLTCEGLAKVRAKGDKQDLIAGVDYVVKTGVYGEWLSFPDLPSTQHFRRTWILRKNRRPKAPSFVGAPLPHHRPGEADRAAMIVMTYFRPWTLRKEDESAEVVYVGNMRPSGTSWQEALTEWCDGNVSCAETKRYLDNFLSVHRVRPQNDDLDDAHSSDMASDEELEVSHEHLKEALETRVGGKARTAAEETSDLKVEGQASHHVNSSSRIDIAQAVWGSSGQGTNLPCFVPVTKLDEVLDAARKSQRREKSLHGLMHDATEREARLQELHTADSQAVQEWLVKVQRETDDQGKLLLNKEQFAFVKMVAERVMRELDCEGDDNLDAGEPLRWLLHGGPGTGKSHAIKVLKKGLFEGVLQWDMGMQFQIVALQAVMADLLEGDTIHHACGIPAFRKQAEAADVQQHMEVAKRVLQWRWLIIDEISMVSAKLLAEIDVKLRGVVREIGTHKVKGGQARPFGGLNVVMCGDFWQLDPPDGGFLGGNPNRIHSQGQKIRSCTHHRPWPSFDVVWL